MIRSSLRGPLFVSAILGTVVAVFWPTVIDLAGLGARQDAYTHVWVVVLIFFFVVWEKRAAISALPVRPWWPGLIGLLGAGFAWLIGQIVFVRMLTDMAVVAMVWMAILTVLGYRWFVALAFPLFFLVFSVSIWGPVVPMLTAQTADMAVLGLQVTGVPIHRDGAYFVIPSGSWAVAEACSGIAYLSTCLMLGLLYAWMMFRSTWKRALFVVGAVVIGIVGNWIRVYLTVLIAHLTENRFLRDDHSTFGWLLYAIVLFGYFWFGRQFRDEEEEALPATQPAPEEHASSRRTLAAAAAALAVLAVWPALEEACARQNPFRLTEIADIAPRNGWSRLENPVIAWTPELVNPLRERVQSFEKGGRKVDVFTGIFGNQTWASKLVTSVNQLVHSDNPNWALAARGTAATEFAGKPLQVGTGTVLGGGIRLIAWRWYWIDGFSTSSDIRAKIQQLGSRLRGQGDASAWVAIYTRSEPAIDPAAGTLDEFMREMGGSLERALRLTTKTD